MTRRTAWVLLPCALLLPACAARSPRAPAVVASDPAAPPPLAVKRADEEVVVAAWAEPRRLPGTGGQAQILVRAQKRGGAPFPNVEVRLRASGGTLYSGGRVLVTDAGGRTRDRLTTKETVVLTVNAGGTVYRFRVPVGDDPEQP
jgi:hypothetical protein